MTATLLDRAAPFKLPSPTSGPLARPLLDSARGFLENALAFPILNDIYRAVSAEDASIPFVERVLTELHIQVKVEESDFRRIPASGPLIVVANHPFGGIDGIILTALLLRIRPDVKLLVNYLLGCIPDMHATSIFVDPFGGAEAKRRNAASIKSAVRWVEGGGVLGVFPAGEVSHLTLRSGCVTDPQWSDTIARIAHRSKAAVVPLLFDGCNTRAFQFAGLVHPRLRTVLLSRELLKKRGNTVRVAVGNPIGSDRLRRCKPNEEADAALTDAGAERMTDFLRLRTYLLRSRLNSINGSDGKTLTPASRVRQAPIALAGSFAAMEREIAELVESRLLVQSGAFQVFCAPARKIPEVLLEIGRLREHTFRLIGEGTGRERDLDRFDEYYQHLFLWNREKRHIVGAYRIGRTDRILRRFGVKGLYTSTLFDFKPRLMAQIDPALEMGRSFVVPEYQKEFAPLMLLWKGIGRYVARHPKYRRLFGVVSISDEFHSMTKQLLMAFLKANCFDGPLSELVRAKNPPRVASFRDVDPRRMAHLVSDMGDIEELISEIEAGNRGVPVLLRQYLKLNARILGFNIDPDFGDVLDGLVLVDLTAVDRGVLNRYFGTEGAAAFLAYHAASQAMA